MATNCNVRQNAISYLKKKNVVDDRLFINSPLFFIENDKLTQYAKQKYGLKSDGKLFDRTRIVFTDPNIKDKYKLVPNDELFKELQERYDEVEETKQPTDGFKTSGLQTFKDKLIDIIGVDKVKELYTGTDVEFDSFIIDEVELGFDKDLIITIKTDSNQRTAFNLKLDGDYQQLKISEGGKTVRGIKAPLSEKVTAIDFLINEFKKVSIDKLTGNLKFPSYNEQKEYYLAKDVKSLLQNIVKFTEDADTKLLSQALLKVPNIDKIGLNVTKYDKETKDKGTIPGSPDALGTYKSSENLIEIIGTLDKKTFETVFLHEMIHGVTVNEYYLNKEFSDKINKLYNYTLKFKDYKTSKGITLGNMYGMTNAKEFMSEAMSNPDFIFELSKYYSPTQENLKEKNIFQEFIDLIVNLIKSKIENKGKKYIENNLGTTVLNTISNYTNIRYSNFKSISKLENNQIKLGVSELFESTPELASIGTQEQYSQYLDSIFPKNKILYHASIDKFDVFDFGKTYKPSKDFGGGFYLADKETIEQWSQYAEQDVFRNELKYKEKVYKDIAKQFDIEYPYRDLDFEDSYAPLELPSYRAYFSDKIVRKEFGKEPNFNPKQKKASEILDETTKLAYSDAGKDLTSEQLDDIFYNKLIENKVIKPYKGEKPSSKAFIIPVLTDFSKSMLETDSMSFEEITEEELSKYDAFYELDGEGFIDQIVFNKPEKDTRILGTQKDIEGFKKFVSGEKEETSQVDLAEALDDDFILNDDIFGDTIQDESEDGIEYQLTEDEPIVNTPPDMSIDEKIERFLQKIGVSVNTVQEIRDRNGRIVDANAKADMFNKIIEVVSDRQLLDTLPEEAAHFFVNMLGTNNPLYKKMFDKITDYQIYARTVEVYKKNKDYRNADGTLNINKLKKEAIGKVIAQHIIGNEKGIESERNLGFLMNIWNQIWDYVKSFFVQVEENPFETSAKTIVEANVNQLNTDFTENELYYQMNEPLTGLLADQENIKLDDSVDPRTGQKRHIYTYKGETAKGSVTTYYVDAWLKKIFRSDQRSQLQKMIDLTKADYGDIIHDQIRKIVKSWTNEDGTKRSVQDSVDKVVPAGPIYNLLNNYIQQVMNQYDSNTKFFAEVKIFDQQKKIAGSVDLIVVKLNEFNEEVVDIYDWKSQEIFRDQEDIKPYKEPMYRIQLENYKKILEKQYGFKNFDKVRAVPIKTSFLYKDNQIYNIKSIEIGSVDPTKIPEDKNYLLPVTLKTESTGQEDLDKLISKLNAILSKIENFKYSSEEKYKKREEINQLRLAIRDLQLRNKIDKFIAVGLTNYKKYNELLASEKLTGKEIFEALRILGVFLESSELLRDMREEYYQVLTEKGDKKELAKFETINKNFGAMVSKVSGLIKAINRYQNEKVKAKSDEKGIKNILDAEAAVGSLPGWFQALSNINRTSFKLFSNLLRRAQTKRDVKYEDSLKKLKQLKINYVKWAQSKGLSVTQGINKILQLDEKGNWNGNFLNKYKKEFYTERDQNIEKGNNNWLLQNLEYDEEKYKQKEKEQIDFIKSVQYYLDEKENEEVIKKRIKEWVDLHRVITPDGKINPKALTNKQNGFLKPNDKWLTNEWNEVQKAENKPLKEMYDYFQSLLEYSKKLGMLDGNVRGFIPSMNGSKLDQFAFGSVSDLFSKKGFFEDLEVDSGTQYTPQIDPTDGTIVNKIPVYFTKDLGVKREDGTMDYSKKSRDLFKIFGVWAGHMYNYEQMQQLEDDSIMILNVERNKGMLVTDMFGNIDVQNGVVQAVDKNDRNAELLESFINYYLYDKQSGRLNDVKFKVGKKEYSLLKTVQSAMSFFSLKTLGLNPISGTANFVGGLGNILFTAQKGIVYTKKTWAEATYKLTSRDKKTWAALDYFSVLTEGKGTSLINDLSLSSLGGKYGLTKENAFIIQRIGDRGVEYPSAVALMLEHMLDGDKIVSIQQYVKNKYNYNETFYNLPKSERDALKKKMDDEVGELKKTKSLLVVGQVNKDGEFELPGVSKDSETFAAFRDKIKGVAKKIIGNQSRDDINLVRTTMLGNALMQFRNWIPEMMEERFDGLKFDEELQTWTYGRANQFFSEIITKRGIAIAKGIITGFGSESVIKAAKEKYQILKASAYEKGKSFDITEGEFIDLYIGNLKAMISELMLIIGLVTLLTSITGGDDDKKTGVKKYLSRALKKYYNEFAFYYNPKELTKIIDQPLPVIGLANDFITFSYSFGKELVAKGVGNEEWEKEAKPLKYFNKMVPIGKEAMMWMAVADDDFRKEWDIRIQ